MVYEIIWTINKQKQANKQTNKQTNKQSVISILRLSANSFISQKCYKIRDFDITDVINYNDFGEHK